MRRHVVRPFGRVAEISAIFRYQSLEEIAQVERHFRIGVLLDDERAGGVLDEDGEQSVPDLLLAQPRFDLAGEWIKSLAASGNGQGGVANHLLSLTHTIKSPFASQMKIQKAVITAAALNQRTLPLQTLIDRDGQEKTVLRIILDEVRRSGVDEIAVVIPPGDEDAFARAAGDRTIRFIEQPEPAGYARAVYCARTFTGQDPFLHLVGDHLYAGSNGRSSTQKLVEVAAAEGCTVSAVQATRETLLSHYGAIGAQRISGRQDLYRVQKVVEKPTPTEAEQELEISGLRAGHYLCFFGMHVLTPAVMDILERRLRETADSTTLSDALSELAGREQYLALEQTGRRYDVGVKYGLLRAQLALALDGQDRNAVLSQLLELVALHSTEAREIGQGA